MKTVLMPLFCTLIDILRGRAALHAEMLAMRQQLAMMADRDRKRLSFRPSERLFWVLGDAPGWQLRYLPSAIEIPLI